MKEFIDTTPNEQGTPINRSNMMAMQGFVASTYEYYIDENDYLAIKQTNADGEVLITYKDEYGNYVQKLIGQKTIEKHTVFHWTGVVEEYII